MPPIAARLALASFALVSALHLLSLITGPSWLEFVTKALLMPTLAAWVVLRRGPWLIVAALGFSTVGDVLLQVDGLFIAGMAGFAAAHVCYVTFFVRSGAVRALRRRWPVVVLYVLAWAGLLWLLWPGLGDLQLPVAAYSLLLTATAVTSAGFSLRAGIGGALFLISDSLIAARIADLPVPPLGDLWVMITYLLAQYLLASAATNRANPPPIMA